MTLEEAALLKNLTQTVEKLRGQLPPAQADEMEKLAARLQSSLLGQREDASKVYPRDREYVDAKRFLVQPAGFLPRGALGPGAPGIVGEGEGRGVAGSAGDSNSGIGGWFSWLGFGGQMKEEVPENVLYPLGAPEQYKVDLQGLGTLTKPELQTNYATFGHLDARAVGPVTTGVVQNLEDFVKNFQGAVRYGVGPADLGVMIQRQKMAGGSGGSVFEARGAKAGAVPGEPTTAPPPAGPDAKAKAQAPDAKAKAQTAGPAKAKAPAGPRLSSVPKGPVLKAPPPLTVAPLERSPSPPAAVLTKPLASIVRPKLPSFRGPDSVLKRRILLPDRLKSPDLSPRAPDLVQDFADQARVRAERMASLQERMGPAPLLIPRVAWNSVQSPAWRSRQVPVGLVEGADQVGTVSRVRFFSIIFVSIIFV